MTSCKNGRIASFENVPTFGRRRKSAQGCSLSYQSIDCMIFPSYHMTSGRYLTIGYCSRTAFRDIYPEMPSLLQK